MAVAIFLGLFFTLLALGFAIYWNRGIIEGFHRNRDGRLFKSFIGRLEEQEIVTTVIVFGAPTPFTFLYAATRVAWSNSLNIGIAVIASVLIAYCAVLWGLTLFLRFKPKQPAYVFHLPGDAEKVRMCGCEDGIWLAAVTYPTVVVRDWLDTFTRAVQVSARESAFPQGRKAEIQLTNDFVVFCNVRAVGCEKGCYGFIEKLRAQPDQFDGILTQLRQGDPESTEMMALLQTLIQQLLYEGEESTGS